MSFDFEKFRDSFFKNRKIRDKEAEDFFNFDFEKDNVDPFLFVNMEKSVKRLKKAIDKKEKILIYTDYDCDGIPSAVILTDFFKKINYQHFEVYIPHRHNEGYGLHIEALERFVCNGYSLVITADLGITNIKEVEYLNNKKIDIILTDHHLPLFIDGEELLPKTEYLINPNVSYESYPSKNLCGAGVAWKLIHAFLVKYRKDYGVVEGWEKWLLDMVAIALVADMVELRGEVRKFVTFGLKVLAKTPRPALRKIFKDNKIDINSINEKDIAFTLAPRINAASRIDHPIIAYKALSDFENRAYEYTEKLESLNSKRKEHVKDIKNYIKDISFDDGKTPILIGDEDWPIGVVGLVAQHITDTQNRVAMVWGKEGEVLRGSIRVPDEYGNAVEILTACKDELIAFGGHEKAGGFSLLLENLEKLDKKLKTISFQISELKKDKSFVDYEIKEADINKLFFEQIRKFSPFGVGNPEPVLFLKEKVSRYRKFGGEGQHVEFLIGKSTPAILFNINETLLDRIVKAEELFGTIEYDSWRNRYQYKINLDIID